MHELAYKNYTPEEKENVSPTTKWSIALGSGIISGFAAAIISHVRALCLFPFPHCCR